MTVNIISQWTAPSAGVLDHNIINERKLWCALIEIDMGFRIIEWLDPDGVSIFGDNPPLVSVLASDQDRRIFNQLQGWGGIWPNSVPWVQGAYSWETTRTGPSSSWETTIRMFGRAASNHQDGERFSRLFVASALGTD